MKTRLLVVDDEPDLPLLIRQKFRRHIREGTYEFRFAHNGQQALEQLRAQPELDIVLSDIRMPVMDGLTLLAHLPAISPTIKAVMVSAYADMQNIRTAMNRGAFDFVCKPVDFQDLELTIEKTAAHVRQLRQTLRALQENSLLKMYVNEAVLNCIARPGFEAPPLISETMEATIVFIDICGFTALAEKLPAEALVSLLNGCFDRMVREIMAQHGHVDKFLGDAVLAVFRGEYHADRAVEAALAVRGALQAASLPLPAGLTYQPSVAIGVHTGEVVAGNIGAVSLKRLDYTVIGGAVGLARRLQAAARPGQLLVTEATYRQVRESFQCQSLPEVSLTHKAQPVQVYEVLA